MFFFSLRTVTLCRWSAKQTIPLFVLARNQTKARARDLDASGSRKGRPEELDKGTHRRQLAKGDASGQSTPDSRSDQSACVSPVPVREDRSRWVGIPSSFVEISLEIHVSVSLHMHKGMQCYITPLLHIELTQAHIVRLFFVLSSHSLDCISCSHEEMCDAPIGTTC